MDKYKRSLKKRLAIFSVYIVLGVVLLVLSVIKPDNDMISCYGCAFTAVGIIRIIRTLKIMKNDESMEKCRRIETDERIIFIANKAKSIAINIYAILGAAAVIVLNILNHNFAARIIAYNMCAIIFIELICYRILLRKY